MNTRTGIHPKDGGSHPTCSCGSPDVVIRLAEPGWYIRTCNECSREVQIPQDKLTDADRQVLVDESGDDFPVRETKDGSWDVCVGDRAFPCSSESDARKLATLPRVHRQSLLGEANPKEVEPLVKLYEAYGITNMPVRGLERWLKRQQDAA